ncbi:hypothetical protein FB446DRAFT_728512 [Lentinula raphanica]|nr:hypothetical protein FB446DRAFT_728512 [Lentinula raphanica]
MRLNPTYMLSLLLLSAVSMSAPLDTRFKDTPTSLDNYAVTESKPIVHSLVTRANFDKIHLKFLPPHNLDGGPTYRGDYLHLFEGAFRKWVEVPHILQPTPIFIPASEFVPGILEKR